MKNAISAELYKVRHDRLIWLIPVLYFAIGLYTGSCSHAIFRTYKELGFFSVSEFSRAFFPFAASVVTGYVIGGDFSRNTIQNALSAGVGGKHYYFSRLLIQKLFTGALFMIAVLTHVAVRLVRSRETSFGEIEFLWLKLAVYMAVVLFQLLAYVSVMNAVCYFVKKQLTAAVCGMGLVYLEVILRQVFMIKGIASMQSVFEYAPSVVIMGLFEYAVYDQIFTAGFLKYVISALIIMAVSSGAGYLKFCRDRGGIFR